MIFNDIMILNDNMILNYHNKIPNDHNLFFYDQMIIGNFQNMIKFIPNFDMVVFSYIFFLCLLNFNIHIHRKKS